MGLNQVPDRLADDKDMVTRPQVTKPLGKGSSSCPVRAAFADSSPGFSQIRGLAAMICRLYGRINNRPITLIAQHYTDKSQGDER